MAGFSCCLGGADDISDLIDLGYSVRVRFHAKGIVDPRPDARAGLRGEIALDEDVNLGASPTHEQYARFVSHIPSRDYAALAV